MLAHTLRPRIDDKLGRCPRCFSLALLGALLWPASFTALWLTHLAVYAARTLAQARRCTREPVGAPLGALKQLLKWAAW